MICSLFNFCPQSAQSRRHGGGFGGLSPQTNIQTPQIETWNTTKQVELLSLFRTSSPPTQTQSSPIENFPVTVLSLLFIFCPQEAQS